MPTVYLKDGDGKILLVAAKVAISPDCCCGGPICPPGGAPTTIEISFTFSGTNSSCCSTHDQSIDFTASGSNSDTPTWGDPDTLPCCASISASGLLDYDCGVGCIVGTQPDITVSAGATLCYQDFGTPEWVLSVETHPGGSVLGEMCNSSTGNGVFFPDNMSLGTDPTGVHTFEGDGNTGIGHWIVTVTIS